MVKGFHLQASIHISGKVGFHAVFCICLSAFPCLKMFCSPFNPWKPSLAQELLIYLLLLPFSTHPSFMLHFILTEWELSSWIQLWTVPSSSWCSLAQYEGCAVWFPCLRGVSFQGKDWASTFLSWVFWQTGERKPGFSKSWEDDPPWQSFDVVVHWHKEAIERWIMPLLIGISEPPPNTLTWSWDKTQK